MQFHSDELQNNMDMWDTNGGVCVSACMCVFRSVCGVDVCVLTCVFIQIDPLVQQDIWATFNIKVARCEEFTIVWVLPWVFITFVLGRMERNKFVTWSAKTLTCIGTTQYDHNSPNVVPRDNFWSSVPVSVCVYCPSMCLTPTPCPGDLGPAAASVHPESGV